MNYRHLVNVMRPTDTEGTRGQSRGEPQTIYKNWPCSIATLNGREVEQARSVFAEATHKVEGYGNPAKRLAERDYLQFGERTLHIGFINDKQQNGLMLSLLCGERTGG